ncbi:Crp/Fnr family transcriptional regulator [Tissierella sp. MSJ-40]|uniref:Crp/Fnr family transcriptional regulator n=1 Tax=Tissierella simiarum TaxID=2841534 RepID=A0ABS6E775_9FIRM|nr:Crp/Fnr family transcriptional regulator [Tissierella simiarum]MBU5438768.1 Crp/Fnr family transcriptional regulator [Tissierella simiarum]
MNCGCYKEEEKTCIEIVPIFSSLTYEEKVEVAKITTDRTFEKGQMIYTAGDRGEKLYVIHKGKVKITRLSETGKEQVIRILGPGEFMGELSLFSSSSLTDNGEALDKTTVCIIDGEKLKELMKKYPAIAFKVLEELSKRLEKAENLIENLSLHGVEKRLAKTLLSMANGREELVLKMSKRDLASYMGMSQETLSRKLSYFQDMGLIKLIGHRRIILLDIAALEKIE